MQLYRAVRLVSREYALRAFYRNSMCELKKAVYRQDSGYIELSAGVFLIRLMEYVDNNLGIEIKFTSNYNNAVLAKNINFSQNKDEVTELFRRFLLSVLYRHNFFSRGCEVDEFLLRKTSSVLRGCILLDRCWDLPKCAFGAP
jgi:hypothetical protein